MRILRKTATALGLAAVMVGALPVLATVVPMTAPAFGSRAEAASFDCGRARRADERAICGNRTLEDRDVELTTLYGLILRLVPMGTRDAIRGEQGQWLAGRGRCGADVACLRRSYDRRIATLRATIDERVVANGPF